VHAGKRVPVAMTQVSKLSATTWEWAWNVPRFVGPRTKVTAHHTSSRILRVYQGPMPIVCAQFANRGLFWITAIVIL
jgi:hypothetical protein